MFKRLLEKMVGSNTLYYPGCMTRFALPDIGKRYERLLRRAGLDFIVLPGEMFCCGSPVKRAGYPGDFEALKQKNLVVFSRFNVRRIITNCPGCYHTLKHDYGMEVSHVSEIFADLKLSHKTPDQQGDLTYHDPCHLGRWSDIYDPPRQLLREAGWHVAELPDNRDQSLCCGAGGGLKSNFPDLANAIAHQRLAQVQTDVLCTACPLCYAHLKENAHGIRVMELSEALDAEEVHP